MQAQVPAPPKPTKLYCLDVDGFLLAGVRLTALKGAWSLTGILRRFVPMLLQRPGGEAWFFEHDHGGLEFGLSALSFPFLPHSQYALA